MTTVVTDATATAQLAIPLRLAAAATAPAGARTPPDRAPPTWTPAARATDRRRDERHLGPRIRRLRRGRSAAGAPGGATGPGRPSSGGAAAGGAPTRVATAAVRRRPCLRGGGGGAGAALRREAGWRLFGDGQQERQIGRQRRRPRRVGEETAAERDEIRVGALLRAGRHRRGQDTEVFVAGVARRLVDLDGHVHRGRRDRIDLEEARLGRLGGHLGRLDHLRRRGLRRFGLRRLALRRIFGLRGGFAADLAYVALIVGLLGCRTLGGGRSSFGVRDTPDQGGGAATGASTTSISWSDTGSASPVRGSKPPSSKVGPPEVRGAISPSERRSPRLDGGRAVALSARISGARGHGHGNGTGTVTGAGDRSRRSGNRARPAWAPGSRAGAALGEVGGAGPRLRPEVLSRRSAASGEGHRPGRWASAGEQRSPARRGRGEGIEGLPGGARGAGDADGGAAIVAEREPRTAGQRVVRFEGRLTGGAGDDHRRRIFSPIEPGGATCRVPVVGEGKPPFQRGDSHSCSRRSSAEGAARREASNARTTGSGESLAPAWARP